MQPTRFILMAVIFGTLFSTSTSFSQSLREKYDKLTQEYDAHNAEWHKRHDAAKTDDELIVRYRDYPAWEFAPKFVELAESAGTDSIGFDALVKVLEIGTGVSEADQQLRPHFDRSLELVLQHHMDKQLRPLCELAGFTALSEKFLKTLVNQPSNRELRADASFCLGRLLAQKWLALLPDSWVAREQETAVAKYIAARCKPGLSSYLDGCDAASVNAEAVKYLKIVSDEYGDVAAVRGGTSLGELARAELYELQNLAPGCQALEIEGQDLLGKPMTLSEFRGKVVLLVFWASWCNPCIGDIPHEKELVARFAGRPFVLVGVNADESPEVASEAVRVHGVTWQSFWNGKQGREGAIAKAWNVRRWPTVYVLDHTGVIKHKDLRREDLDKPLEKLIAAAESRK